MAVITLTTENFEKEVLKSDKPVLVDFWASLVRPLPHGRPHCG
jgi:thioredoxin 1